jgi:hypothetical protein
VFRSVLEPKKKITDGCKTCLMRMHHNFVLSFEYYQIKEDETMEYVAPMGSVRNVRKKYSEVLEEKGFFEDVGSTRGSY